MYSPYGSYPYPYPQQNTYMPQPPSMQMPSQTQPSETMLLQVGSAKDFDSATLQPGRKALILRLMLPDDAEGRELRPGKVLNFFRPCPYPYPCGCRSPLALLFFPPWHPARLLCCTWRASCGTSRT
jgi:hypothetical protein